MIKNIVKDEVFLKIPSALMTKDDLFIVIDMKDTLKFHLAHCVGMAGNMLGYQKRIISFVDDKNNINIMINPEIIKCEGKYETLEGCLSLAGKRPCVRYKKIKVAYLNENLDKRIKTFTDFTAEIIQHEIDHLNGILI